MLEEWVSRRRPAALRVSWSTCPLLHASEAGAHGGSGPLWLVATHEDSHSQVGPVASGCQGSLCWQGLGLLSDCLEGRDPVLQADSPSTSLAVGVKPHPCVLRVGLGEAKAQALPLESPPLGTRRLPASSPPLPKDPGCSLSSLASLGATIPSSRPGQHRAVTTGAHSTTAWGILLATWPASVHTAGLWPHSPCPWGDAPAPS